MSIHRLQVGEDNPLQNLAQPRMNNEPFRSEQTIEDLYVAGFHDFFSSTAHHMKNVAIPGSNLTRPGSGGSKQSDYCG